MAKAKQENVSELEQMVGRYNGDRSSLIPILQDLQESHGFLSEDALDELARSLGVSPNEIFGVATFYAQFRFRPPGEHTVRVCLGTACHVRGGHQVLEEVERRLGIKSGETSADGQFDLERVACVGCCALAPVAVVDGKVHAGMTPRKVSPLLAQYGKGRESKDA